jgi:hypothetical protein
MFYRDICGDFYLWDYLQPKVYADNPCSLGTLHSEIQKSRKCVRGEIQCVVEFDISVRNVRYYSATILCDK